jgi:hypothetical protein
MRLYGYKYGLGLFKSSSKAQGRGSVIHAGVAHGYARRGAAQKGGIVIGGKLYTDPETICTPSEAITRTLADQKASDITADQAIRCVEKYFAHWKMDKFRVLHIEEEFAAHIPCEPHYVVETDPDTREKSNTLVSSYLFTTRMDFVVENEAGQVLIMDTKSTSAIEAKHPRYYSMSGQFAGLRFFGNQCWPERFGGAVLNLIQTREPFAFQRPMLDPAPAIDIVRIVLDAEARIEAMMETGRPYSQWPGVFSETGCYTRYGLCPAAEACRWGLANAPNPDS